MSIATGDDDASGRHREQVVECASYTHARRHPLVLGRIGGWTPPFQLTVTQLAVLVVGLVVGAASRPLWGRLPGGGVLVVAVVVAAAWLARYARPEGRSPLAFAAGWVAWAVRPRRGMTNGRRVRRPRRSPRPGRSPIRLRLPRVGG